jgi:hypothetical protein
MSEAIEGRKVRQLVVVSDTEHQEGIFAVVCEDGTMWERRYLYNGTAGGNRGLPENFANVWLQIQAPPEPDNQDIKF